MVFAFDVRVPEKGDPQILTRGWVHDSGISLWTLLGAPAVVVPSGLGPNALPLGLQAVGDVHADGHTLAVAAWCERVLLPQPEGISHPPPA